ncbi:MAG: nucleoside-diphosphate kinase, partial [Parcubacteria group bacterium]|nr:nucleoside-diphosphate kinase [Parcubacteria group bacterium]
MEEIPIVAIREKMSERTLIILKPDATKRQLTGKILMRFEERGLKIVGLKMLMATRGQLKKHFPSSEEWMRGMAQKTLDEYAALDVDPVKDFGTNDALEIGRKILASCYEFYLSGPLVAVVIEGVSSVAIVRKMVGNTLPALAEPGTVRGDFAFGDARSANMVGSPTKNIIH